MSDNNLKIDITLRKYENNKKEIIKKKEIFKDRKTKLMLKSILDEYLIMIRDFGINKNIFKVTREIKIDTINNGESLMKIVNRYIDIELLEEYCDDLGIIVNIRKTTNELFFDFILNKELYEEGVYDFCINSNNSETYIDDFNMSFRKK